MSAIAIFRQLAQGAGRNLTMLLRVSRKVFQSISWGGSSEPRRARRKAHCRIIWVLVHSAAKVALVALQCFVVIFVALHNWIPLGKLSDVKGVRAAFPTGKLLVTTLINFTPFAFGLAASVVYFGRGFPGWLFWWLWISYGLAVYGSLKAWWIPYLLRPDPALAARYRVMYGATHAFLPERNGIRPNTLHVIFDVATVAILFVLGVLM
jgi:hypothetical protein